MQKKVLVRTVAGLLALFLLGTALFGALGALSAKAVTQDEIDDLKQQEEEIIQRKYEIEAQINSLEYQRKTTLQKKSALDIQIEVTQEEIKIITAQIEQYALLIKDKENEVVMAQRAEDEQWELYKIRIRAMEENGTMSYIAVVFNAKNFADLLARLDFVDRVMKSDKLMYNQLQDAKQATIAAKESLEDAKAVEEAEKVRLLEKKAELIASVNAADMLIKELKENLTEREAYLQEVIDAEDEIYREIEELEERLRREEEAARASGGSSIVNSTGNLRWPVPSSYGVSSPYGTREHPIWGGTSFHTGIDIPANHGSDVIASDGGRVEISTYHYSFGNYILVNHGGVTTMYAHLSEKLVSEGDYVSSGEVIGYIGSTGDSTGPHLHFEVRVNGERVDPGNYFYGYAIWY